MATKPPFIIPPRRGWLTDEQEERRNKAIGSAPHLHMHGYCYPTLTFRRRPVEACGNKP